VDALKASALALGVLFAMAPAAYAQAQIVSSPGATVLAGHHPQAVDPDNGDEENSDGANPI